MSTEELPHPVDAFVSVVSQYREQYSQSPKFQEGIDELKDLLQQMADNPKTLQVIVKTLEAAGGAIPALMSGDPFVAIPSVLGIIGGIADMMGPAAVAVSLIMSVMSGILGALNEPGTSLAEVVTEVLKQFRGEEILDEAHGTSDAFGVALDFMNGVGKSYKLTPEESSTLSTEVQNDVGAEYLGELASFMRREAGQAQSIADARRVLAFVQTYCHLAITRELILIQKYCLLKVSRHADGVADALASEVIPGHVARCKEELTFVNYPPTPKEALVASVCDADTWPVLANYATYLSVPKQPEPARDQKQVVQTEDGSKPSVLDPSDSCLAGDTGAHLTECVGDNTWVFSREVEVLATRWWSFGIPLRQNPRKFATLKLDLIEGRAQFSSGAGVEIKTTFTEDGKCLLSPGADPDLFFRVKEGAVLVPGSRRGVVMMPVMVPLEGGDPGPCGYWKLSSGPADRRE